MSHIPHCWKSHVTAHFFFIYSGTYRDTLKGENLTSCLDCPQGYYCPTGQTIDPLVCQKGNYSNSAAIACTTCAPGRYCDVNATGYDFMNSDRVCPAGLECPEGMYRQPDLTNNYCRKGYYCPRGDINPYPVPCPTGTYSENTGLKQVSECTACTAGWYCNQEGLTAPEATCPGGYYCPRGTGDYTIYACPIGYYRNGSAKESFQDCAECTSGYYCDEEGLATPKDCPRGNLII